MKNIGNLNLDSKTYIHHSEPDNSHIVDAAQDSVSRIQQDLIHFSTRCNHMDEGSLMLRRTLGRAPRVCIVGAGVAGLRCADLLLQHGVQVTILEGRDRVGGRLCQSDALGHIVDLGPNWIHGTDDNPILDLAKQTKTLTMNWDGRQAVYDHIGQQMPDKEAAENTERVWNIIGQAMKYSNDNSASIPAEKSLFDYFQEQVKDMFPLNGDVASNDLARKQQQIILQMAEMWGAFVGSPIRQQSLKFFWLEECIDGENLFVAGTYTQILAEIVESARKATMKFLHKVKRIVSKEQGQDPQVTVEIEGHEDEVFDEVVMTAPLGWLKTNLDVFVPELPNRLKESIAAIGYGHLDKVYINFETAFWNEATSNGTPVPASRDSEKPNVTATTAPLHQNPDSELADSSIDPAHHPGFAQWVQPMYAPDTNPSHWNQEAVNLAALPGSAAYPTLLFYIFGPTSMHIAELLSANPQEKHHELLNDFFRPYYSRLANYSADDPSHQPRKFLATVWASDELAGYGSYCNFQVGLQRGDEDIEVMRRGMPERGVWLAGEHTSPFVALGTVTGAYWSGEGVAKNILKAYGMGQGK